MDPKIYSTSVYRMNASTRISKDATLKSLSLSGVVLTPAFDSATTTYTAAAPFSAKQTTVTAMANHAGARNGVKILPNDADTADSAPGHQVNLTAPGGEYTITVEVTPEAGVGTNNVETYTIMVTRSADEMPTLLSTYDADGDGEINIREVGTAIDDFFDGLLDLDEVSAVIDLFFE